jgi:hypothetical protein
MTKADIARLRAVVAKQGQVFAASAGLRAAKAVDEAAAAAAGAAACGVGNAAPPLGALHGALRQAGLVRFVLPLLSVGIRDLGDLAAADDATLACVGLGGPDLERLRKASAIKRESRKIHVAAESSRKKLTQAGVPVVVIKRRPSFLLSVGEIQAFADANGFGQ